MRLPVSLTIAFFFAFGLFHTAKSFSGPSDRFLAENSSNVPQFLPEKMMPGAPVICQKGIPCRVEINTDESNILMLEPGSNMELRLHTGSNKGSLKINYGADSPNIRTELFLIQGQFGRQSDKIGIPLPDGQRIAWTKVIPEDLLNDYPGYSVLLSITHDQGGPESGPMPHNGSMPHDGTMPHLPIPRPFSDRPARVEVHMSYDGAPVLMIVLIAVGATALLIILLLGLWYIRIKKRQLLQMRLQYEQNQLNPPPVVPQRRPARSKTALTLENLDRRFPEGTFEQFNELTPGQTTCSICIEELRPEQECRQLYCNHIFHSDCIKVWLTNRIEKGRICCPNCNRDVSEPPPELLENSIVKEEVKLIGNPNHKQEQNQDQNQV